MNSTNNKGDNSTSKITVKKSNFDREVNKKYFNICFLENISQISQEFYEQKNHVLLIKVKNHIELNP